MQITREDWWATPVWYFDIPIEEADYVKIAKECYLEKSKNEGRIRSNRNGWQSDDIYANAEIPSISNVIKTIDVYSKNIFQDYGIRKEINLSISNSWININFPGSHNTAHTHPQSILSGVYYVSAPENSGNFLLKNNSITQFINELYLDQNNKNTYSEIYYKPIAGKVIIFPPWVPHYVEKNKSNEDRISIAFNFNVK
jgi:uncharacterized protein (TIGR02466 family)